MSVMGPFKAVGAQNDLGGQQTSARKIACLSLSKLNGFSVQIEVFSKKKKKKRSSLKLRRFFAIHVPK